METPSNIGIQLFTYDQTCKALQLLHALKVIVPDAARLRIAWRDHDGTRKTIAMEKLISDKQSESKRTAATRMRGTVLKSLTQTRHARASDLLPIENDSGTRLNDCYIQIPATALRQELRAIKVMGLTVH